MKKLLLTFSLLAGPVFAQQSINGIPNQNSYGDILDRNRPTGTLAYQKNDTASLTTGSTLTILSATGAGYVDNLFIALKGANNTDTSTVNIYYEGSGTATISAPIHNFCMGTYLNSANNSSFMSNYAADFNALKANNAIACNFKLPIPFTSQILITLSNTSGATETVWSVAEYQTGVPNTWPNTRHLHVDYNNVSGVAANAVTTIVNYTGSAGRFVGLFMMDDGFPGSISPFGAELEGNVKLYFDGNATPNVESSGIEDWFGFGFYFGASNTVQYAGNGGSTANTGQIVAGWGDGERGLTLTSNFSAYETQGAYRFHIHDRRIFNSGLKLTAACGDTTEKSFTGTCTQFWTVYYYTAN